MCVEGKAGRGFRLTRKISLLILKRGQNVPRESSVWKAQRRGWEHHKVLASRIEATPSKNVYTQFVMFDRAIGMKWNVWNVKCYRLYVYSKPTPNAWYHCRGACVVQRWYVTQPERVAKYTFAKRMLSQVAVSAPRTYRVVHFNSGYRIQNASQKLVRRTVHKNVYQVIFHKICLSLYIDGYDKWYF